MITMHSPNPILGGFILCCHLGGSSGTGHHPYNHQQWMSLELIGIDKLMYKVYEVVGLQ